jgi:hypothetical protein
MLGSEVGASQMRRAAAKGRSLMKRMLSALLATVLVMALVAPLGGCGVLQKAKQADAFTTDYATDESNIDFFVDNDEFESLLAASPFYAGAQQLPTPGLREFEAARVKKVDEIIAAGETLYAASATAKPGLIALRSSYIDFLDAVYKLDRSKLTEFKKGSTLKESKPAGTKNADALLRYLQVSKAVELGGYQLQEANDIAAYSAIAVNALKDHPNGEIKKLAADYDTTMSALDTLMKELDPVASGIHTVDGGLKQLASADYYMAREASNWMAAELPKVETAIDGMQPKEGVSAEDIEFFKANLEAYTAIRAALDERLSSVDASALVSVRDAPRPGFGLIEEAYAAGEVSYTPNQDAAAAGKVLATPAPAKSGWLSTAWGGVKGAFNKATTVVGVGVDAMGAGVYNITRVSAGWYYGSPVRDTIKDVMDNTKSVFDDYNAGMSGSKTIRVGTGYIEDAEKGVGWVAGEGAKVLINKPYQWLGGTGDTRLGDGAAWVTGGLAKITAGMFTGFAKGIYKVADKGSNAKDVAGGLVDIGLSFIGGSKVLIKGSTVLKGAQQSATNMGRLGQNFLNTWRNASTSKALAAEMGALLKNKGLTSEAAWTMIRNGIALDVRSTVANALAANRAALITRIKNAAASALTSDVGNWKQTVKSSLQDLFVTSFANSRAEWVKLMTTVVGGSAAEVFDNLVASQVDPIISGVIAEALAGAPEPAQMNGTWNGAMVITEVPDTPEEEKTAKEGCDFAIDWGQLKGQKIPVNWTISMDESGAGTVQASGDSGSGSGTIRYSDGDVTISLSQDKVTMTLSGTAAFADAGGMTMSGSWSAPLGPGVNLGGTWSAAK